MFSVGQRPKPGPVRQLLRSLDHTHTHTHSPSRTPLDEWSARRRSTTHKKPAIPPIKRLQILRLRPHGHRDRPNFYVYVIHYDQIGNALWEVTYFT